MKKLFLISVIIMIIAWLLCGCKTTKVDKSGNQVLTWNARHQNTVHKKEGGFYAGGHWVTLKEIKPAKVTAHK